MTQNQPSTSQTAVVSVSLTNANGSSSQVTHCLFPPHKMQMLSKPKMQLFSNEFQSASALSANSAIAFSGETETLVNGTLSGASSSLPVSFGSSTSANADPDAEDPDVGRLQALLEARGIPPHVFGSLGKHFEFKHRITTQIV